MPIILPNGTVIAPHYVTNGSFMAAAIYQGFKFKSYKDYLGNDYINVNFNMSKSILDEVNCRVRPDSGRAQDTMRKRIKVGRSAYI